MLWDRITSDPEKAALARVLIERVPLCGWGQTALLAASEAAFEDATKWRRVFPRGSRDAIWFISEVSDASMTFPFIGSPAQSMSTVIIMRLEQNAHLKPFVRKVMLFDVFHPAQAFSRMQRTSRAMFTCLGAGARPPSLRLITGLNIIYTGIIFLWLFDQTEDNARTKRIARRLMPLIGMS